MNDKIREHLRALRRSTGKTQIELAADFKAAGIKISAGSIARLENGSLPLSRKLVEGYAKFFQCRESYLTGESEYRDSLSEFLTAHPDIDARLLVDFAVQEYTLRCMTIDQLNGDLYGIMSRTLDFLDNEIRMAGGTPSGPPCGYLENDP